MGLTRTLQRFLDTVEGDLKTVLNWDKKWMRLSGLESICQVDKIKQKLLMENLIVFENEPFMVRQCPDILIPGYLKLNQRWKFCIFQNCLKMLCNYLHD